MEQYIGERRTEFIRRRGNIKYFISYIACF
nr:MAG TPA: hypothetical protein [Caudoviricetes sp.]